MRGPIIVLSDDVELFESVADAERYLEAPDVRSGNIRKVYDRDGRKLRPVIRKGPLGAEHVEIADTPETPDVEEFRDGIVQLLVRCTEESPDVFSHRSIDELIAEALPYKTR